MVVMGVFSRLGGLLIFANIVFALILAHRSEFFTLTCGCAGIAGVLLDVPPCGIIP